MIPHEQYQTTKPLESRKGLYTFASLPSLQDVLVSKLDVHPDMRVLDVGCGYGDRLADLTSRVAGLRVSGFDLSEAMIAAGKERLPELDLEVSDLDTFVPKELVDRILAVHVLHLHPNPVEACRRMLSWLVPGGKLVIVVHSDLDQPRKSSWDTWLAETAGAQHEATARSLTFERDAGITTTFITEPSLHTQTITLTSPDPYLTALESHRNRWLPAVDDATWTTYLARAKTEIEQDIQTHGTFVETTTNGFLVITKPL